MYIVPVLLIQNTYNNNKPKNPWHKMVKWWVISWYEFKRILLFSYLLEQILNSQRLLDIDLWYTIQKYPTVELHESKVRFTFFFQYVYDAMRALQKTTLSYNLHIFYV